MKHKPRKLSLAQVIDTYHDHEDRCIQFFFDIIFPSGFYCERCGCTHHYVVHRRNGKPVIQCKHCKKQYSLVANTVFERSKLSLFQLILGFYLFFSSNKGISAFDLSNQLGVNYKTARDFSCRCRLMMGQSNGDQILESKFYEADVAYIGEAGKGKQGMGTAQQSFLVILATDKEGRYPTYAKTALIEKDNKANIDAVFEKKVKMGPDRVLNTDGKTTFSNLKGKLNWKGEKINYEEEDHRLYWLNKIVSLIKGNIKGIYHGVSKRELSLFINEQEWRYNHRYIGNKVLKKVQKYLAKSQYYSKKMIKQMLDNSQINQKMPLVDNSLNVAF